jgi:hypothetical protein
MILKARQEQSQILLVTREGRCSAELWSRVNLDRNALLASLSSLREVGR